MKGSGPGNQYAITPYLLLAFRGLLFLHYDIAALYLSGRTTCIQSFEKAFMHIYPGLVNFH